jgi:hypothetical protein
MQPSQPSIGTGEIRIERDRRLSSIDRFLDLAAIIEFIAVGEEDFTRKARAFRGSIARARFTASFAFCIHP